MLSGGQKQRIAIAGMLAMDPEVLVLDEATAMLDPMGRRDILRIVRELHDKKGITVIMITQYMEEAVGADRVIVMNGGHIVMEGTPAEVFRRGDELRAIRLDVPAAVEMRELLLKEGVADCGDAMTLEELSESLCRSLLKN
jgi:energy-coupling factor transport system ATP-binding protein